MVDIELDFAHSYEIEELPDLPGTGRLNVPLLYFPRPTTRPERDGLWLRIGPATGKPWVGVFGFGYQSPPAISRVVGSPDQNRVCVVSRGTAYIVEADNPEIWEELPVMPVLDIRQIPNHQLLVFADFTRLIAYGRDGLVWKSSRLCSDDLTIHEVTDNSIDGVGYDPADSSGKVSFAVDIRTGRSLSPPLFPGR